MVSHVSVDAWSVIFSHVEWDDVSHYKRMSRLCKTFYKACHLGAAQYFRWDATKLGAMFFRDSVRAVTVSIVDQ
jgi:hypothetical protein